jgi:branched-chain amino acid transport system permease protein
MVLAGGAVYEQAVVNGLLIGGLYLIIAVGLSLVFGVLDVINIAHGGFVAVGAYTAYTLQDHLQLSPYLSLPVAFVLLFVVGWLTETLLIRRVRNNLVMAIVTLFGLALIIQNALELRFSVDPRGASTPLAGHALEFGSVVVPQNYLATFLIALATAGLLSVFLRRTRLGRDIRAVRMDRQAAAMLGIDVQRVFAIAFSLGAGLAGVGGVLAVTQTPATPSMTLSLLLPAFAVVTLGGLGSVGGAVAGAVVYGVVQSVATVAFGIGYSPIIALATLLLVLLVRPTGMMGNRFYA